MTLLSAPKKELWMIVEIPCLHNALSPEGIRHLMSAARRHEPTIFVCRARLARQMQVNKSFFHFLDVENVPGWSLRNM